MNASRMTKVAVMAVAAAVCLQPLAFGAKPGGSGSESKGGGTAAEEFTTKLKGLKYNAKTGKLRGRVRSNYAALSEGIDGVAPADTCVKGRKVTIKKGSKRVGKGTTDAAGRFSIKGPKHKKAKNFTAKVKAKEFLYFSYGGVDTAGLCVAATKGF